MKILMISAVIGTLALSACKKNDAVEPDVRVEQTQSETTPKQTETAQLSAEWPNLSASGNEPFWTIKIDGFEATYTTPENLEGIKFAVSGEKVGKTLQFKGQLQGEEILLAVTNTACENDMSGDKFPMTATLIKSSGTFGGCAQKQ